MSIHFFKFSSSIPSSAGRTVSKQIPKRWSFDCRIVSPIVSAVKSAAVLKALSGDIPKTSAPTAVLAKRSPVP